MQHHRNKEATLVLGQRTPVSPTEADIEMQREREEDASTDEADFRALWYCVDIYLTFLSIQWQTACLPCRGARGGQGQCQVPRGTCLESHSGVGAWVQGSVTDQRNSAGQSVGTKEMQFKLVLVWTPLLTAQPSSLSWPY